MYRIKLRFLQILNRYIICMAYACRGVVKERLDIQRMTGVVPSVICNQSVPKSSERWTFSLVVLRSSSFRNENDFVNTNIYLNFCADISTL